MLDIGDVCKQSGVSPATLRYYDEIGLVKPAARRGLRRQYSADTPTLLALIALGKAAGFSLDEIAGMIGPDGQVQISRHKLNERAQDLDRQINRLTVLKKALLHTAECEAPSHLQCKRFQHLLKLAQRHQKPGHKKRAAPK